MDGLLPGPEPVFGSGDVSEELWQKEGSKVIKATSELNYLKR